MRIPFALEPTALNLLPSGRVVCSETSVQVPTTCCFSWATALLETNASPNTLVAQMLRMLRRFIGFLLLLRAKRAHETHRCMLICLGKRRNVGDSVMPADGRMAAPFIRRKTRHIPFFWAALCSLHKPALMKSLRADFSEVTAYPPMNLADASADGSSRPIEN